MGVASIPVERKDHRACHELRPIQKMDIAKGTTEEFVTVVSVGSQPPPENFVTVLSIGNGKKDDEETSTTAKSPANGMDGHLEEEVEVFRLPGERLGFGLKFEGGNKTSERVRRLFVQSCAEQSPASRAKCSWGTLGEGDEVLSIDGIPVTHMTRLDCVRRLKESQLVIRLMVRCRGALRPEVVSAERKIEKSKVPPELPAAPPPVPPRKLRHPRGSADGEANPSPVKKLWNGLKSQNGSQNSSPVSQAGLQCVTKVSSYESCESSPRSVNGTYQESPKGSPKDRSPEFAKLKQEPPEAMVYLDARSQCGSTHGSTSDDTGSSMSTVVDRFSTSDRVSTISTTSTASTAGSEQQLSEFPGVDRDVFDRSSDRDALLSRAICPLEHLERDFSHPPDYLLRRLASSEAVTHVESRGEVERITAVVAPNTVLIEETITLQPPLSFQDAPLSYGHEARPDLFYTADLAADSTTHFRPIKDDVELVERVNGNHEEFRVSNTERCNGDRSSPPPLPARNHVNRICVNQTQASESENSARPRISAAAPISPERELPEAPLLPPKPLPRKDVKARRKRPPPPPPPPIITPRRDVKPSLSIESNYAEKENGNLSQVESVEYVSAESCNSSPSRNSALHEKSQEIENSIVCFNNDEDKIVSLGEDTQTNKVFEIIEIRVAKSLQPDQKEEAKNENSAPEPAKYEQKGLKEETNIKNKQEQSASNSSRTLTEHQNTNVESIEKHIDEFNDEEERHNDSESSHRDGTNNIFKETFSSNTKETTSVDNSALRESEDDETYQSLDEVNDDMKNPEINRILEDEEIMEEEETTDESDDGDYYWQSNLATIGEEEETTSLEYMNANTDVDDSSKLVAEPEESPSAIKKEVFVKNARDDEADRVSKIAEYTEEENKSPNKDTVNGKMENCGGGQRLPPDGDEFPAAYQEFSNSGSQPPYRYMAATRTATIATNGSGLCNENETFHAGETFKMLANDSNVVDSRSIILPDNKMTLTSTENVRQDINKIALSNMNNVRSEIGTATSAGVDNVCREGQDVKSSEVSNEEGKSSYQTSDDIAKKNALIVAGSSLYPCQATNSNLMTSEKKMEIAGYYHKDVATIEEVPSHVEKDTPVDIPPPLPLTGPPKMEQTVLHAKNISATESPQRKFSLNGDLWRQDDKSERSVRDKIAMFSSQSNIDAPLFPNAMTAAAVTTSNGKRLSKYKSSEDVCCDDKSNGQKDRPSFFADRTQSSFDLTDSSRSLTGHDSARKYSQRAPSLLQNTQLAQPVLLSPTVQATRVSKTLPVIPPKTTLLSSPMSPSYDKQILPNTTMKNYCVSTAENSNLQNAAYPNSGKAVGSSNNPVKAMNISLLTRATSFSGATPFVQDRNSLTPDSISNSQISRTNSLASTFRRPGEDARRSSLNQLIEQRRRSISKLRGLVIPEKETVPIDQPIVDLPEIKSRDSILLHQIPKANIQDKWGSQSSLASNTSTASQPLKATSFKMPAPQIHSKYSPAFKRKSLTVYGTSVTMNSSINGSSPMKNSQSTATSTFSEPPKSLESICSPTRSDYSFEFASTTSSPDGSRTRPRTFQRKARLDYDDSDNDSAVSSSQSSISRGFSPPMSPVPSERSTVSSERSYISTELNYQRRPLIADSLIRTAITRDARDQIGGSDKDQFGSRIFGERTYVTERSSSSSSSSNPRSPQPNEFGPRNSQIPQRQLRRSNSTDTNCSTSSTLTSGSQASAESLSRRVLKPQSVEAINRKNILASARCRSGRDLNGSPLIQRKFSDEEDAARAIENGGVIHQMASNPGNDVVNKQEIKIAYIEVTDPFADNEESSQQKNEAPKLPPKRSVPPPAVRSPKSEILEPSNDLKMWVRAEAKTLARSVEEKSSNKYDKNPSVVGQNLEASPTIHATRNNRGFAFDESVNTTANGSLKSKIAVGETKAAAMETSKQQSRSSLTPRRNTEDQNDLLTILTTKSRSRSAIHVDEGTFGRSKSQMSLEDILGAKADSKLLRTQSMEPKIEKNGTITTSLPVKSSWDSKENRYERKSSSNNSWSEDRSFVSKIPTLGKPRTVDSGDEISETVERTKISPSKIPTSRGLNRRSASVTDMKKVLEKIDTSPVHNQLQQNTGGTHNRFPSLDSSVDENMGTETDTDRCYSEQFGSISSLASSTSLISQQELAQLVEEASLEETRGAHDVIVVLLHKENPTGSVGITLAGGADCEVKEITIHRVLTHSIADKDGRMQRGDRILSINGRSTRGLTHRESMAVLKQPRSEVVLVVSRARTPEEGCKLRSRTASVETIVEGLETNGNVEDTAWGPPSTVAVYKDGTGLGFSLEGGRDSPLGDRPLIIKKIFTGGAAEKTGALKAGDQLLEVNGNDVTRMSRIEAWSLMKKLHDGEVNLLVRHPATKSS